MKRIALVLVLLAACSSFSGSPSSAPDDAGAPDASVDALTAVADDGGTDSGDSGMIAISAGGFAIDPFEVTADAYGNFIRSHPDVSKLALPPICAANDLTLPTSGCTLPDNPAKPQVCVDWCDAITYCLAMGKRLCGARDPGTPLSSYALVKNPTAAQWMYACTTPTFQDQQYPYGLAAVPGNCNNSDSVPKPNSVAPVGSFPTCVGGAPGLFDMTGNAYEWIDGCDPDGGACYIQGGSYTRSSSSSNCDDVFEQAPTTKHDDIGFRCCKDL